MSSNYILPYIISNIIGLLFLWAAIKKPPLARLMFLLLFSWACVANYTLSHQKPEAYLEYANSAISWYADFINGWFRQHITVMVSLIAMGEGLIAIGMLLKGWWVKMASIGVIIFLIAISPLGYYAGFPFEITVSLAAYFIIKKDSLDYLWKFRTKHKNILYE
jgi:hypothetical protein